MSATATFASTPRWQPTDRWLLGIVVAVINFWLFAQTLLNVIPGIQKSLGLTPTVANLAVSVAPTAATWGSVKTTRGIAR